MATQDRETRPSFQAFLLMAAMVLAGGYGVAGIAREAAQMGPKVGDIISFDPAHPAGLDSDARLTVARAGGPDCVLDVQMIRRSGGSLVLEQRDANPTHRLYRAHWAGRATSGQASENCGTQADVVISNLDMGALAAAAGGFGADHSSVFGSR